MERIGCVVMAAGNARRFESNKLAAEFDGKPLIRHALETVPQAMETVVVTQYPQVARMAEEFGFACVENPHPDWGISYTIRLGTRQLSHCDAIVYLVSDQPMLKRASVEAVAETWRKNPDKIVGLGHGGKRGNPCIFPKKFYPELMELEEDAGGNTVIRRHLQDLLLVEAGRLELTDVDTPKALEDLRQQAQKRPQ